MELDFYSQFKKSDIAKAVRWENNLFFKWREKEKKIFLATSFIFLFLFGTQRLKNFLGIFLISFVFYIFTLLKDSFFEQKIKNPKPKGTFFDLLDFEIGKALYYALSFSRVKKINSSIFLFFILDEKNKKIRFIISRLWVSIKELKKQLLADKREEEEVIPLLQEASGGGKEKIKLGTLLFLLAQKNKIFKNFLIQNELKPEDLKETADWIDYLEESFLEEKKFWKWENLLKFGTLAREWTAGYTILLDQFSVDITATMRRQGFRRIFAHEEEVKTMETILASPEKNDVLLIGEPGSGRRSMLEFLANKCARGESLPELNFKRVVYLDLPKVIAQTETIEEAEIVLDKIFSEAAFAGNVILVIDNIHQYVGVETERKAGVVEISGILSSYVASPNFYCIAITTHEGLHRNLEQKPTFLESFEKIEIKELSEKENLAILEDRALRLEQKYKVFFTFPALREIISLTSRYLPNLSFPEKAIDVLDELAVFAAQRKEKIILPKDVEIIIERKTKIPIGEAEEAERKILLNLEEFLHQRIIDQEEAIKEVSEALRRARAEIKLRKGPIGCFLFLGPTGVGKTETAKALTEVYFGAEDKMIRLDMSEFQNLPDIARLLGAPGEEGLLTTPVRERPFSLVLLDEFEKAHPQILNLFLQVLDEGHLTDGMGRRVDFKNTIIIATSNAGYEIILESLKEKTEWTKVKEKLFDFIFQKGIFRPELLNRFDAVVVFKPLSRENLLAIAELLLKKIKKQLAEKDIEFIITQPLKEKIVDLSYNITFGAREMQRVINEKVGNVLAKAILARQIKRGSRVEINAEDFSLKIN